MSQPTSGPGPAPSRVLAFAATPDRLLAGLLGGLAGTLAFGAMMVPGGMLGMVAAFAGLSGEAAGWAVHLGLGAAFGLAFGLAVPRGDPGRSLGLGLAWGLALWAVAAMVVMRLAMGMPVAWDAGAALSLQGHLVFGALLGLGHGFLPRLAAGSPAPGAEGQRS